MFVWLTRETAALAELDRYPRPTAASGAVLPLVRAANPALLRRHGRLDDAEWAEAWSQRLEMTRRRLVGLLEAVEGRTPVAVVGEVRPIQGI